jgi:hypothetical protein
LGPQNPFAYHFRRMVFTEKGGAGISLPGCGVSPPKSFLFLFLFSPQAKREKETNHE